MSSSSNSTDINIEVLEPPVPEVYHEYQFSDRDFLIIQNKQTQYENDKLSPRQRVRSLKMIFFIVYALRRIRPHHVLENYGVELQSYGALCHDGHGIQTSEPLPVPYVPNLCATGLRWIGLSIGSFMIFATSVLIIKLSGTYISSKNLIIRILHSSGIEHSSLGQHFVINVPPPIISLIVKMRVNC